MIELGVSLYPEQETPEQIDSYLAMAQKYGFTKVFTSLFSVPGPVEEVCEYFKGLTAGGDYTLYKRLVAVIVRLDDDYIAGRGGIEHFADDHLFSVCKRLLHRSSVNGAYPERKGIPCAALPWKDKHSGGRKL